MLPYNIVLYSFNCSAYCSCYDKVNRAVMGHQASVFAAWMPAVPTPWHRLCFMKLVCDVAALQGSFGCSSGKMRYTGADEEADFALFQKSDIVW